MPMSTYVWVKEWELTMAEAGFPKARLTIDFQPFIILHDGARFSYSWTPDVDMLVDVNTTFYPENAWDEAHRAFVAVDHLRPKVIEPSPMLASLMTPTELDKESNDG